VAFTDKPVNLVELGFTDDAAKGYLGALPISGPARDILRPDKSTSYATINRYDGGYWVSQIEYPEGDPAEWDDTWGFVNLPDYDDE
jgi:hypothetical protein